MTRSRIEGPAALRNGGMQLSLVPASAPMEVPRFEDLYDEHFDFVWRTLARLGVPERSLDDATHDTFVVVHGLLPGFEGRSSVRTWLYSIARKVARDHRRSRKRNVLTVDFTRVISREPSPEEWTADRERAQALERLLEGLSEEKREAFVLVEIEELSVVEAAQALSVNLNTMYARIRAARRALEQAIRTEEEP